MKEADSVVELTLQTMTADTPLVRLARELNCVLEFEGLVSGVKGETTVSSLREMSLPRAARARQPRPVVGPSCAWRPRLRDYVHPAPRRPSRCGGQMSRDALAPDTEYNVVRSEMSIDIDGFRKGELTGESQCCSCGRPAMNIDEIPHRKDCDQR